MPVQPNPDDKDKKDRGSATAMAVGGAAGVALPSLALAQYLRKTHPAAEAAIRGAHEVSHETYKSLPKPGDIALHASDVAASKSPLTDLSDMTVNMAAGTIPSGLPATHASQILSTGAIGGGHSMADSRGAPVNDAMSDRVYGLMGVRDVLMDNKKFQAQLAKTHPDKRKALIDAEVSKLMAEHTKMRELAKSRRTGLLAKPQRQTAALGAGTIGTENTTKMLEGETANPQMLLRRQGPTFDEAWASLAKAKGVSPTQFRASLPAREFNKTVAAAVGRLPTRNEASYMLGQTAIDRLTPYGASGGALAGLRSVFLPSLGTATKLPPVTTRASARSAVCDPGTNICSSVPARLLHNTGAGGDRSINETFPGHLITDYATTPVAITKRDAWLKHLAAAKARRTAVGVGAAGLLGLAGAGLGYGAYRMLRPKDKTEQDAARA